MKLIKRSIKTGNRTRTILKRLGIPYKVGYSFWALNEADLPYLYYDFRKRAREVKAQLHPDNGGNTKAFQEFNTACQLVERAFEKHL
jgi:hypothetical protein